MTMKEEEINHHLEILIYEDFKFHPQHYIKDFIRTPNDIVSHKHLLKGASLDSNSIEYLVDLVVNDLKENRRFRRVECLKVLKQIIKNRESEDLPKSLISKLFYLYKSFILVGREEIQWAVSLFIKDQVLDNDEILWLIDNYQESDHLVNRLLRYPKTNSLIFKWAENVYKNGLLLDRQSEVVAILISDSIPKYISVSADTLMWGIYYSRCDLKKKEELIVNHLDFTDYLAAIKIAARLNIPTVVKNLLDHYMELASKR